MVGRNPGIFGAPQMCTALFVGLTLLVKASAILAAGEQAADLPQAAVSNECDEGKDCNFNLEYLLRAPTRPFLVFGKTPDKKPNLRAMVRFPDAQSCLAANGSGNFLDNAQLNWTELNSQAELEVCIFRMASMLDNVQMTRRWLSVVGFNVGLPRVKSEAVMRFFGHSGSGIALTGSAQRSRMNYKLGWLEGVFVHSHTVGITFNSQQEPLNVHSSFTRE